jgi:hypothetical protein
MAALPALFVLGSAGCTWLVAFDTLPCDGGSCVDAVATEDSGRLAVDSTPGDSATPPDSTSADVAPLPDVIAVDTATTQDTSPPPDVVVVDSAVVDVVAPVDTSTAVDSSTNPCMGKADGTSLNPLDPYARCCGGMAVETTSDTNCGICGIACNTGAGQSCGMIDQVYLCLNCQADGDCWSGCCGGTVSPPHCGANDCSTGTCTAGADPCAPYNASCNLSQVTSGVWYCAYP